LTRAGRSTDRLLALVFIVSPSSFMISRLAIISVRPCSLVKPHFIPVRTRSFLLPNAFPPLTRHILVCFVVSLTRSFCEIPFFKLSTFPPEHVWRIALGHPFFELAFGSLLPPLLLACKSSPFNLSLPRPRYSSPPVLTAFPAIFFSRLGSDTFLFEEQPSLVFQKARMCSFLSKR